MTSAPKPSPTRSTRTAGRGFRLLDETRVFAEGIRQAREVTDQVGPRRFLISGPPVALDQVSGPTRGAIIGGLLLEGEAATPAEAEEIIDAGEISVSSAHDAGGVGALAGLVTPSMPVISARADNGRRAFAPINEGLGRVLRFGAYGDDVISRLRWIRDEATPVLNAAFEALGDVSITDLQAEGLRRGDECHNRNIATTAALLVILAPAIIATAESREQSIAVIRYVADNPHFFLSLSIAAGKAIADSAHDASDDPGLLTAMAFNGRETGIRVSGCGDKWFLGSLIQADAKYFDGFGPDDAAPTAGDSAITEVIGLGGSALSASPALTLYTGGDPRQTAAGMAALRSVCRGESSRFKIPYEGFVGCPLGFDVQLIAETGITPLIDMGVAHRNAGVGQIGAGVARMPLSPFVEAALYLKSNNNVFNVKKGQS